jgi:tRNA (adenine22-N1)-methyltransferase
MGENLSPRLRLMLGQGIDGQDFWDICCDHGLLGAAALASARFRKVHFVDRVPHIIEKLKERLGGEGEIVLSGAEDLNEEISGTAVIAGVGGFNIIKILENWEARGILRAQRLILNPLTHIAELRDFLSVWTAYGEKETLIVRESERDRQVIVIDRLPSRLRT